MAKNIGGIIVIIVVCLFIALAFWIVYKRSCTSPNESIKFFEFCKPGTVGTGSLGGTKKCKQKKRRNKKY